MCGKTECNMRIEKKTWPEYFQKILDGVKTYDIRLADFNVKVGDILVLKEYNPTTKKYTGRIIEKKIKYVGTTKNQNWWSKEDVDKHGFVIMNFA